MSDPYVAIGFMALTFGFHIAFVNIDIGLGIIIPLLKRLGEVKGITTYIIEARKYMRYLAIIYASAGVFGTAFTVFLLTFFPSFLWLGGLVLIYPFGLAVMFLILRLFSIGAYWYTWDKLRSNYHFYLGLTLAFTSFAVPYGFRVVFAFLNYPVGIKNLSPLELDPLAMFTNPTLLPLYLKSITGGLLAAMFTILSLYAYSIRRGSSNGEANDVLIRTYLKLGIWLIALQLIFGFWYLATLSSYAPYKFSNIVGAIFGGKVTRDYFWLFIIKMLLVAYQLFVVLYIAHQSIGGKVFNVKERTTNNLLIALGPSALLTIVLGEYLNAFSQLPYFIAQPTLEEILPMINIHNSINDLAAIVDLYAITIFGLIPLFLAFFVLLYYIIAVKITN